jgi:hypothetical protein
VSRCNWAVILLLLPFIVGLLAVLVAPNFM